MKVLLVGFGKLGRGVFRHLDKNHQFDTFKRSELEQKPEALGKCYTGNVASATDWKQIPKDYDLVLYCVSPGSREPEVYCSVFYEGMKQCLRHFETNPAARSIPKVLFVSSTSVYAQDDDGWVDENSPAVGSSATSSYLVKAEQVLADSELQGTVVRFSGIYGAGRNRLITMVKNGKAALDSVPRYSNRIHEDDCIGFLTYLIGMIAAGQNLLPCYLASDSRPATMNEVYAFIADNLGIELKQGSETASRGRAGSKRCSNTLMLQTGYELKYPSFVDGYSEALVSNKSE